ncbi:SDR family NAD(P)-dependent oxidoreductase, partial [Tychonema sp. BBK16]|uniref:SDR family NAD(P)-dependent oxidoreductase n=1 Tax=Tychonema sp. BBK16 TaxID=2699888 RepID=UPI001F2111C7
ANETDWRELLHLIQGLLASGLRAERLLIGAVYDDALSRCHAESWIGIARSLRVLVPQLTTAVLLQRGALQDAAGMQQWAQRAWRELCAESMGSVCYDGDARHELRVEECALVEGDSGLTAGGVYWITGGAGGLGAVIAQHLLQRYGAKVVLSGRREPDVANIEQLKMWNRDGGELLYVVADVTDATAMRAGVAQAVARFGRIDGVIHAAGVADAQTLAQKSAESFAAVLSPKVRGTQVLDEVLAGQPLRFVCYFSSSAALLGDFGGGDYAMGNRFELAYAQYVEAPPGCKRIAIAWPLWEAGGMQVGDASSTKLYLQASGQQALTTAQGVALWERALAQPGGHYV